MKKYRIVITGIVQGVGFRPFIYNLAVRLGLKGWVGNADSDVIIEIETGNHEQLEDFIRQIENDAPVLSRIESVRYNELAGEGFDSFAIRESQSYTKGQIFISPDVATCQDCIGELKNKDDRRYMYPFINCTNCGPRFTIIKDIPYDRDKTTMNCFEMCGDCRVEYTEPADRRYHAQPVSCRNCGPSLKISGPEGENISDSVMTSQECIDIVEDIIKNGKIAAIKGIGGYHLACDALNDDAVNRLRKRKHRDDKPFALMMKSLDIILKYCKVNSAERQLLESPASPVVLLEKKEGIVLPVNIAPLNRYLGVMLPYTPIHHILFEQAGFPDVLVMTSGNLSSEPIFYRDSEAVSGLKEIADVFLTNDREIYMRTDDSVTRVFNNREYIIRRSRGYVPKPIKLDVHSLLGIGKDIVLPSVLACGGELKNVFCLSKGNLFYLSHHIGDMENESTNESFRKGIEHFKKLFDINPEYIAYDLHPNYYSSKYAFEQSIENKIGIQHHKAHIASCMAENNVAGDVIGVSFDGTGFGEDGCIWGGEFFRGGYYGFERAGHLEYVMLPGGDAAVKHPWRTAVSYLFSSGLLGEMDLTNISQDHIDFIVKMLEKKINCPKTSSMGRFFDAVSALLEIKTDISYEGQAAIELEYYAGHGWPNRLMPYETEIVEQGAGMAEGKNQCFEIKTGIIMKQIIKDIKEGRSKEYISSRFHTTIADIILMGCKKIREESGLTSVALSGGVFQNITLLGMSVKRLAESGFMVYTHSEVPANDAGIALGQAMMALAEFVR